jgi:uncharacterized protein (TIGR02646 family)
VRPIVCKHPPHLPAKWAKIYLKRANDLSAEIDQAGRAKYLKKYGSWKALKPWLSTLSNDKCWYCEAKSKRAPFDVDHFRPKLGVTVDGERLANGFGYHWIAYAWWNFRLSCQRCNRPENDQSGSLRGKANEFPIRDEALRAQNSASDLALETPRVLDPCVEADCELLAHGLDGEVKPSAAAGTWDHERARYTIDLLGFNGWNLAEDRRSDWQTIAAVISLSPDPPPQNIVDVLKQYLSPDREYSRFFRSAIGTHRDKHWVEELL